VRSEENQPAEGSKGSTPEEILKAKYLDFCSAQVADILLLLSPDEMFVLAQDAAREAGMTGELGYEQIVTLATERVSRKLALPPFDIWLGITRRTRSGTTSTSWVSGKPSRRAYPRSNCSEPAS
jgi:hypothetical protein